MWLHIKLSGLWGRERSRLGIGLWTGCGAGQMSPPEALRAARGVNEPALWVVAFSVGRAE